MTSQARIDANRANARGSTGPKSVGGKSLSRFNALKSGAFALHNLLPGEDINAFESLSVEVQDHYHPSGPIEGFLVRRITRIMWRLERLDRAEYAALKVVEIRIALRRNDPHSSYTLEQYQQHKKNIEDSVIEALAQQDSLQSAIIDDKDASGRVPDEQKFEIEESDVPPTAYAFLEGYAGERDHRPIDRIDQQKRALTREYFATIQMLKGIQADRKTVNVPETGAEATVPARRICS